ncbi:MAG: cytochrome c oxidase subunit 3 [Acidobacteria bacterium]|nr:cytochrome c oxidase subunit 3 [Acidobacteriota bacterium]
MAFAAGSNHLDAFWGGLNTLVLIVSSLTMALTVYYAQKGNRNMQVILIIATMFFGAVFLGVKAIEYSDKFNHGLVPVAGLNHKSKAEEPAAKEEGKTAAGEKHEPNPRGEFQWTGENYEASVKIITEAHEKKYLTKYEEVGYYSNGELDQNKVRDKVRIFYWIYFVMTGLHALHMIVGLGLMTWLLIMAWRGTYSADYYSPVEISGLYWHFVDIVWIFLFPLLYLLGRHFMHGGGH